MITRPFRPDDFGAVHSLIQQAARADRTRTFTSEMLRVLLGIPEKTPVSPESDTCTIVEGPRGSIAGCALWDLGSDLSARVEGWVHPECRRSGVGTALLTAAEVNIRQRLGSGAIINARGYQDIVGLEPLFRLRGFAVARRFFLMHTRLDQAPEVKTPAPRGIVFRNFRENDLVTLTEADNDIFSEHWGRHTRSPEQFRQNLIDTRPHDPSLWILATEGAAPDAPIVGECLCNASNEGGPTDGYASIVGVRREWRGKGLGRALLERGFGALFAAGFRSAMLMVDENNLPALTLYRSAGMDIARSRLSFAKSIARPTLV